MEIGKNTCCSRFGLKDIMSWAIKLFAQTMWFVYVDIFCERKTWNVKQMAPIYIASILSSKSSYHPKNLGNGGLIHADHEMKRCRRALGRRLPRQGSGSVYHLQPGKTSWRPFPQKMEGGYPQKSSMEKGMSIVNNPAMGVPPWLWKLPQPGGVNGVNTESILSQCFTWPLSNPWPVGPPTPQWTMVIQCGGDCSQWIFKASFAGNNGDIMDLIKTKTITENHWWKHSQIFRPQQWTFGSVSCWLWHIDLLKWIMAILQLGWNVGFKGGNRSNMVQPSTQRRWSKLFVLYVLSTTLPSLQRWLISTIWHVVCGGFSKDLHYLDMSWHILTLRICGASVLQPRKHGETCQSFNYFHRLH